MVCFIRTSTIEFDVRLQKYVMACAKQGVPYIALTWDRLRNCKNVYSSEYQYKRKTPYGRKWKNIFNKLIWQFHIINELMIRHKSYKVIHVCDSENILPALLMKAFGKKVILDIYDSAYVKLERACARHFVDLLILPTSKRLKQLGIEQNEVRNFLEVENVPTLSYITPDTSPKDDGLIYLAYVGTFDPKIRGIENLIKEVLENPKLKLDIAGTGGGLDDLVKQAAESCDRIKYHGVVDYPTALSIISKADYSVAMYYNVLSNHTYASPNKYYESLYLGVPIITTTGTLVGNNAESNRVGYAIGETQEDLHKFFQNNDSPQRKEDYCIRKGNCKKLWDQYYSNYDTKKLCGEYIDVIKEIAV